MRKKLSFLEIYRKLTTETARLKLARFGTESWAISEAISGPRPLRGHGGCFQIRRILAAAEKTRNSLPRPHNCNASCLSSEIDFWKFEVSVCAFFSGGIESFGRVFCLLGQNRSISWAQQAQTSVTLERSAVSITGRFVDGGKFGSFSFEEKISNKKSLLIEKQSPLERIAFFRVKFWNFQISKFWCGGPHSKFLASRCDFCVPRGSCLGAVLSHEPLTEMYSIQFSCSSNSLGTATWKRQDRMDDLHSQKSDRVRFFNNQICFWTT